MKQYMLTVHGVEGAPMPAPEVMQQMFSQVAAFNDEVQASGTWVFGGGLMPPATATVVTVDAGKTVLTDGPFAETKEHVGGFWVIKAADLDEAIAWGTKASAACLQPVEVRPFQEELED